MSEGNKLYFGSKLVMSFKEIGDYVEIVFEDASEEMVHRSEWDACKSETPKNENYEFEKMRMEAPQREVLKILEKYNVKLEDLGFLLTMVRDSLQMAVNQAKEIALGKPAWSLRTQDIQRVFDEGKKDGKTVKFTTVLRKVQGSMLDL